MNIIAKLSSILLPKQLVVTFNGQTYQILRSDPGFKDIKEAINSKDILKIEKMLNKHGYIKVVIDQLNAKLENICNSNQRDVEVKYKNIRNISVGDDGSIKIGNKIFNSKLAKKIEDLYVEGHDITSYCEFLNKIVSNSSEVIRSGLLDFIEVNDLPITTRGTFLAYKVVDSEGKDFHSGTINYAKHLKDNTPVEEDRAMVDSSRGICSGKGLYFASIGYYQHNGHYTSSTERRFVVEVDPVDVVSIPTSYECSKGRCCKMLVIKEIGWDPKNVPNTSSIIDVEKWELLKPVSVPDTNLTYTVEVAGTQKLVNSKSDEDVDDSIEDEAVSTVTRNSIEEILKRYIVGRHSAGINPTIKNAQKALHRPGTSVSDILSMAERLGYKCKGDNNTSSISQYKIKK